MSERNKRKQQICFWLILLLWAGLSAAGYYYSGRRDPTIDFPTGWKLQLILCGRYLLGFLLGAAISGRIDRIRLKKPFPQLENLAGLCLLAGLCMESLFPLPVPV